MALVPSEKINGVTTYGEGNEHRDRPSPFGGGGSGVETWQIKHLSNSINTGNAWFSASEQIRVNASEDLTLSTFSTGVGKYITLAAGVWEIIGTYKNGSYSSEATVQYRRSQTTPTSPNSPSEAFVATAGRSSSNGASASTTIILNFSNDSFFWVEQFNGYIQVHPDTGPFLILKKLA